MKIILTGGGSGGHITPILAVARELKRLKPAVQLVYIGQKGDDLADLPRQDPNIDEAYSVRAGKLRRYHGEGLKQLLDLKTMFYNARDMLLVAVGLVQSWWLLRRLQPACVFVKGGFVGVPVGLAAAAHGIPYITHDSDILPGLANRIIARWAVLHAVALPKEVYSYPADKTVTVGVPVHANFQAVTPAMQAKYRQDIGLQAYKKIILVTGGGLGARRLNEAMVGAAPSLLRAYPELAIVHMAGRANEQATREQYEKFLNKEEQGRVIVEGYMSDLYRYSAAADIIVTRAGATSLAEFAAQQKACVIVPNPQLTGGHQLKNAEYLAKQQAIEIVTERTIAEHGSGPLEQAIHKLLDDDGQRKALATKLATFARPGAAKELAVLLLDKAHEGPHKV